MSNALTAENWQELHGLKFVDQPECWTTCGGGYCCKTNSPHLKLNLMKPNTAGMVFFEEEYRFLENQKVMQAGFRDQAKFWRFSFAPGLELRFVTSVCSLEGKCTIPQFRPLLCKMYPFFPRVDFESLNVTGYVNASVVDQVWKHLKIEEPCTLAREKSDLVIKQMQPSIEVVKKYPSLLFYIKAAELFLDQISENFSQLKIDNPKWTVPELVTVWEFNYLAGRAFDRDRLQQNLREQHDLLTQKCGDFKL